MHALTSTQKKPTQKAPRRGEARSPSTLPWTNEEVLFEHHLGPALVLEWRPQW